MADYQQEDAKDVLNFYVEAQEKQINELNNKLIVLKTKNTYIENELRKEKAKAASDSFLRKMAILKRENKNLSEQNKDLRNKQEQIENVINGMSAYLKYQLKEYPELEEIINIQEKKPVRRGGQLR